MKSTEDVNRVMEAYADMVRRICFVHLKNRHDTEDVFQNVYMKYLLYEGSFESSEHEKAWFARVTINACTDWLRALSRRKWVPLDALAEEGTVLDDPSKEVLEAVLRLPEKYRDVIYLFYYEEYTAVEIAKILGKKENTVYPGQKISCGKSWEVNGHERCEERDSEEYGEHTGDSGYEAKYTVLSGGAADEEKPQHFAA